MTLDPAFENKLIELQVNLLAASQKTERAIRDFRTRFELPAPWRFLQFEDAKSHLVPPELELFVTLDLTHRNHPVKEAKNCYKFSIDQPGFALVGRPIEIFKLFGLEVHIPCEDVGVFSVDLKHLEERMFPGGYPYYKLHGLHKAWVLTPAQRDELLKALDERYPAAAERTRLHDEAHFAKVKEQS